MRLPGRPKCALSVSLTSMKFFFRNFIWIFFTGLILGNVYIFLSGIQLSNDVNRYEQEIKRLHSENTDLEKQVFEIESLRYTASMAATLNFTEQPAPIILDNSKYAFNR
jgi:hypothetical protein